ncbi:chitinase [Streptomonospora nanhaiensis]|uniref:chitinase n=1 Tax=Streptomonospora nanhaiensis TaxID=1323731 RepID=A0A853BNT1_9ACTN|nr:chitinase [Streptomonospora nanhaiensis]
MTAPRRTLLPRLAAALTAAAAACALALTAGGPAAADDATAEAAATGPWLTGYWHNFDNGSTTLPLSEVPAAYNLIAVAFADNLAGVPGGITFNLASSELGGYTEQRFKDDIAAAQAQGRRVVLSVGGQNGHVNVTNATEAANFADSAHDLMVEYGFDGIDIDLEHGINAQYMEEALRALRSRAGSDLIITMAPQTIDFQAPSFAYYQLARNIGDILTIVNMQYYNSGSMLGCDGQVYSQGTVDFVTAQACIQLEMGLRPDQVGLGLPATPQAAGGGHQSTGNVIAALDCLEAGRSCGAFTPAQPYGPIGGVMTWSVNWDATNGYAFANAIGARLGTG